MEYKLPLPAKKTIALIAHDHKKDDLLEWVKLHESQLADYKFYATSSTGKKVQENTKLEVSVFYSGPYGGDMEIGAEIVRQNIHMVIFFWDPLSALPHDPDVRALLRICTLWDIPLACNRTTADFLLCSSLLDKPYDRVIDFPYQSNPNTP